MTRPGEAGRIGGRKGTKVTIKPSPVRTTDECVAFIQQLEGESDRGFILVVAAIIDEVLRTLLARNLVDDGAVRERLLGINGPLGEFGNRAHMAFGLGLIDKSTRDAALQVGSIRNTHAHDLSRKPFDDGTSDKIRAAANLIDLPSAGPVRLVLGSVTAKLLMTLVAAADMSGHAKPMPAADVDTDELLRQAGHKVD